VPVQATLVVKAVVVFAICLVRPDSFRRLGGGDLPEAGDRVRLEINRRYVPLLLTALVFPALYGFAALRFPGFASGAVLVNFSTANSSLGLLQRFLGSPSARKLVATRHAGPPPAPPAALSPGGPPDKSRGWNPSSSSAAP
jgi:hypothetical protein